MKKPNGLLLPRIFSNALQNVNIFFTPLNRGKVFIASQPIVIEIASNLAEIVFQQLLLAFFGLQGYAVDRKTS